MSKHLGLLVSALTLTACGSDAPVPAGAPPTSTTSDATLAVQADSPAGAMPPWFEPSAYLAWATGPMKLDFARDSVTSRGMAVESTQLLLGPSTSLADYEARLATSGLAEEAQLLADAGAQLLIQIHGMPLWISSSRVKAVPPGCEDEWPTHETVAPDPAKWSEWEAAVRATVSYFNVTHGLSNVWFQFWEEPDSPCFWTDTQARFLETWGHFVAGARSADASARVGGPEPANGPEATKPGESQPLMRAFVEYSAANDIQLDFVSYHLFGNPPEQGRLANRQVLDLLAANGFSSVPIIVGSWNPLNACYEDNYQEDDPSWPSPPSPHGCWQTDNEMGATYSLAFMSHLSESGTPGYQAMYVLDDADVGGSEEFPHDWGLRTNKNKNGIRKAIYHAHTIVGRMPRALVTSTLEVASDADAYYPHLFSLTSADGDRLSMLVWSYVTSPAEQASIVLTDMGYAKPDFLRWGGLSSITAFLQGDNPASALTTDTAEQAALERMKRAFDHQRALVTKTHRIDFDIAGFASTSGYQVTRYLIDDSHNNPYATYLSSGLAAAIADQHLQVLDTQSVGSLSELPPAELKPYAVMLIEIERKN